jgi:predicted transcriptional regulator
MYRANLSHEQTKKFVESLLRTQLLQQEERLFVTTERGRDFIETFHEIQTLLDETSPAHVSAV